MNVAADSNPPEPLVVLCFFCGSKIERGGGFQSAGTFGCSLFFLRF